MATLKDALNIVKKLSAVDKERLKDMMLSTVTSVADMEEFMDGERFSGGRVCPHCGGTHVIRHGHYKSGKQRLLCKECGRTFTVTTNSIVSGTRKDLSTWEKYIDCMMNGFSLRKTAERCGITVSTAFIWRHKILDALQKMAENVILDGIVESDETFLRISYKGNHSKSKTFKMPRESHKRGVRSKLRGVSKEKVCISCAVNRAGLSIAKISNTGRLSTSDVEKVYAGRIREGSTLITDKHNAYVRFAERHGLDLIQLKGGKSKKGIYHIQHVNNYHSQLTEFIRRFKGVSTKYLNNYLIWHNLVNYAKETYTEKKNIFLAFVLTVDMRERCADIPDRSPIPILP